MLKVPRAMGREKQSRLRCSGGCLLGEKGKLQFTLNGV